jgi:hypothetical protein
MELMQVGGSMSLMTIRGGGLSKGERILLVRLLSLIIVMENQL